MDNVAVNMLSAAVGILASLLFSYVPGLRVWYAKLSDGYKRLVMLVVIVVSAALLAASSCLNLWPAITCNKSGFMKVGEAVLYCLIANQSTYLISQPTKDVKTAKANRK